MSAHPYSERAHDQADERDHVYRRVDDDRDPSGPLLAAQRRRWSAGRSDAGAGTVEYVGIVTASALLVVALLAGFTRFSLGDRVTEALCELTNLGGGGGACTSEPARSAQDYVPPPPCVVSGKGGAWQGSVAVGVQVEGGKTWFVESLGDDRYRLTRTGSVGAGVEGGLGFDASAVVNDNRYGAALGVRRFGDGAAQVRRRLLRVERRERRGTSWTRPTATTRRTALSATAGSAATSWTGPPAHRTWSRSMPSPRS